jgi:hypothetical protein
MKIKLKCTDNDRIVEADLLNHRENMYLEVAINTVKLRLAYRNNAYAGSMAGLEFVANPTDIPKEYHYKPFRRQKS